MKNVELKQHKTKQADVSNPLISIIIPVFNREKFIVESLESLLCDHFEPKEIIVVDDGSTDQTATILSEYSQIKYLYQEHKGVAVARNTGIKASTGDFIAFHDSDNIWVPGRLKSSVEFFINHPEIDYIIGQMESFLDKGVSLPSQIKKEWMDKPQITLSTAVLVARRGCFDIAGLFNPQYCSSEDLEWFQRAADAGLTLGKIPAVFVKSRIHQSNISTIEAKNRAKRILMIMHQSVKRKKIGNDR